MARVIGQDFILVTVNPIGPYVAARELPGAAGSAVLTLRATDRLTGIPVLLHVLPYALTLPDLPEHPNLLPIVDSGMDGERAYVVTELPLHAHPASDPLLAARGALAGLAALHGRGLLHGGIGPSQLWTVDGHVALAGAGLPWHHERGTPGADLRALALAIQEIGMLPPALRPLLEDSHQLSVEQALALLDHHAAASSGSRRPLPERHDSVPDVPRASRGRVAAPSTIPAPAEPVTSAAGRAAPLPAADALTDDVTADRNPNDVVPTDTAPAPADMAQTAPPGAVAPARAEKRARRSTRRKGPADTAPQVAAPKPAGGPNLGAISGALRAGKPGDARPGPTAPPAPESRVGRRTDAPHPVPDAVAASAQGAEAAQPDVPAPVNAPGETAPTAEPAASSLPAGTVPADAAATAEASRPVPAPAPETAPSAAGRAPVSPFSTAPAGTVETPQERRRRQNEERRAQAMLDAQAAAKRKAERLRTEAEARHAAAPTVQIGFTGPAVLGEDDLPDWTPEDDRAQSGDGPPRLRLRDVERLPPSLRREPEPEPEPEPQEVVTARDAGHLPSRRSLGEPIRIGWDEDDSWRVVKAAPSPPPRTRPGAPRWLLPLVGALVLLLAAVWLARSMSAGRAATPPVTAACCDVPFVVRGATALKVHMTVETAPAGANLTPGEELGVAPGTVHFPVKGTYLLRLAADGFAATTLTVNVPHAAPVPINLGD